MLLLLLPVLAYPHVPGEEEVGEGEVPVHDAVPVQVQQPRHHLGGLQSLVRGKDADSQCYRRYGGGPGGGGGEAPTEPSMNPPR